jgi:hypothetical protein
LVDQIAAAAPAGCLDRFLLYYPENILKKMKQVYVTYSGNKANNN